MLNLVCLGRFVFISDAWKKNKENSQNKEENHLHVHNSLRAQDCHTIDLWDSETIYLVALAHV